jgi:hypothetical protein
MNDATMVPFVLCGICDEVEEQTFWLRFSTGRSGVTAGQEAVR